MKKTALLTVTVILAGVAAAFAQATQDLDKIVVTSGRVEQSAGSATRKVDVITAKDLAASGAVTVADALNKVTSMEVQDYGGLGGVKTVQMRGATSQQVLVMVDGRPANNAHTGEVDLNTLPVADIDRIEVLRGAASGLYGSNAMGGVVNIITRTPPKEKQKTSFTTSFGTYRTWFEQLVQGGRLGKFGYVATGEYKGSGGFRDHSEYSAKNGSLKTTYDFTERNTLTFDTGIHHSNYQAPGSLTFPTPQDYQRLDNHYFDLTWDVGLGEATDLKLKGYENVDRMEFTERDLDPVVRSVHLTTSRGFDGQVHQKVNDLVAFLVGFNYVGNFDDSTKTAKHKYTLRAGYGQVQLTPVEALEVDMGCRVDAYTAFGTQASPNISMRYKIGEKTKVRLGHSWSYRVPTFSDLFWPNDGWSEGNPDLRPEKGKSYEFGAERTIGDALTLGIGYFRNDFKQLIKWDEASPWFWKPHNIGSASIQGVEFDASWKVNEYFDTFAGYTFQRPLNLGLHKYLTYQPLHKSSAGVVFHDANGLRVGLKATFANRVYTNEANTAYLKRYFLFGADISKKVSRNATVFMNMDNLSNRVFQIQRDYPMPGFTVTGGCKLDF